MAVSLNDQLVQLQRLERAAEADARLLCRHSLRQNTQLDAAITAAEKILTSDIGRRVNNYSALDWLFYLRAPSARRLLGWLNDGFETMHHAEFFASQSTRTSTDTQRHPRGIRPILNEHRFRRIAQLIGTAFVWRQLRVFRSLHAMGIEIRLHAATGFLEKFPTPDQDAALKLYNRRIYSRPMLLVSGGGIAATTGDSDSETTTFVCVGITDAGFQVGPLGLAKFRDVFSLGVVKAEFLQAIGDLLFLLKVGYIAARNSGLRDQLDHYGMFCIESRLVTSLLEEAQKVISPLSELIPSWSFGTAESLQQRAHSIGHDFGFAPPLRTAGEWSAWDLFAASSFLDELLFRSLEKRKEERGPIFEDDVQAMIDRTSWGSPPEIRSWRGRNVKIDDKVVTDIDAIGCRDSRMLLVECKSIYYGLAHGLASQNEIRNAREKVEAAVRKCSANKLSRATNIDFKDFSEITRIVCTPVPVYVAAEYAKPDASGFPNSISYWELYHLLWHGQ